MKYLESNRISLASMGVYRPQPDQSSISLHCFLRLFSLGLLSGLAFVYVLVEAKNLRQFVESFYICDTCLFVITVTLSFALKSPKMYKLLDDFEAEIQKREKNILLQ